MFLFGLYDGSHAGGRLVVSCWSHYPNKGRIPSYYGKRNLYHLFFEKGIKCMKKGGVLSYITPDTYFSGNDTAALRKYFVNHVNILSIIHYTEKDKVFENIDQLKL